MKNYNNSTSIIICTYKRQKWVENLLVSISEQTVMPKEIIVVDAYEKDIDYSYPDGMNIKLLKSGVKALTYQKNLGLDEADGDIIFFLDDDLFLEKNYIEENLDVFNNDFNKKIGAVSGYITNQWGVNRNRQDLVMKIAEFFNLYDGDFSPGSVSSSGIFVELNGLQPFSGIKKIDFVPGGCTAFRKEVFEKFRPPLHVNKYGGEDKTFSRMIAGDWEMCVCGDAKLQHFSAEGGARQTNYSETKSTVKFNLFIQKNYGKLSQSTIRLRLYYIVSALRMYMIAWLLVMSLIKLKKSIKWFNRASGYMIGAISRVDTDNA